MTLIVDAGPIVAMHDRNDPRQAAAEALLRAEPGLLVIPAPVSAEIDHLLARRLGEASRQAFLEDCAAGRYAVTCLTVDEYEVVLSLERRYAELAPGLADLSIAVLAHRHGTDRIATFDERDFRMIRPIGRRGAFTLLPD
ncbi:MAG: PIN domain-containing protein [Chloroflexi bacterium]|nr:PIN domain-containing protein [Chloroflexota bacterium]